jgi:hypothetical protein
MYKVVSYYQEDPMAIANFHRDARVLLSEYNYYLRNLMLSILNGTSETTEIVNRLDKTQTSIGKLLTPFYPMETGLSFAELLKTHVTIVTDYITAMRAKQDLTPIQTRWVTNTDEIATLLNSVDPIRWPKGTIVTCLTQHANYIHRQIMARMENDWAADIEAEDLTYHNLIDLADVISTGIVMSNLEKFSK